MEKRLVLGLGLGFVALFLVVEGGEVSYDGRSLIIHGQRNLFFSASIHYPRSTPEMWASLISKAKKGGIDVIQTYVFWNLHEPVKGQYDFSGRADIVRFIKEIQAQGLYASLRIGPVKKQVEYEGVGIDFNSPEQLFVKDLFLLVIGDKLETKVPSMFEPSDLGQELRLLVLVKGRLVNANQGPTRVASAEGIAQG
ncbi:hypothetical protein V6N13_120816 [Hibiscus sabdariffa]|uniref:beta-galactosidase n=1 Tax=Hibiscus sabdariffa TaxID=183260 RepID=A0ABR2E5W2_9ROSI